MTAFGMHLKNRNPEPTYFTTRKDKPIFSTLDLIFVDSRISHLYFHECLYQQFFTDHVPILGQILIDKSVSPHHVKKKVIPRNLGEGEEALTDLYNKTYPIWKSVHSNVLKILSLVARHKNSKKPGNFLLKCLKNNAKDISFLTTSQLRSKKIDIHQKLNKLFHQIKKAKKKTFKKLSKKKYVYPVSVNQRKFSGDLEKKYQDFINARSSHFQKSFQVHKTENIEPVQKKFILRELKKLKQFEKSCYQIYKQQLFQELEKKHKTNVDRTNALDSKDRWRVFKKVNFEKTMSDQTLRVLTTNSKKEKCLTSTEKETAEALINCYNQVTSFKNQTTPWESLGIDLAFADPKIFLCPKEDLDTSLFTTHFKKIKKYFNDHMASIFGPRHFPDMDENSENTNVWNNLITWREFTFENNKLKNSKATGHDGIPNELLKSDLTFWIEIRYLMLLMGFVYSVVDLDGKFSLLQFIPKPNKNTIIPINNRPISKINTDERHSEKVISNRVNMQLQENPLSDAQYAYLRKRNIQLLFTRFNEFLKKCAEKNLCVIYITLDIHKTFDQVLRPYLIYKMHLRGFRGRLLWWLVDWLINRFHQTLVGSTGYSLPYRSGAGVPQGGPFAQLLWDIDIDPIILEFIERLDLLIAYADDLGMCVARKNYELAGQYFQHIYNTQLFKILQKWAKRVNPSKCDIVEIVNPEIFHEGDHSKGMLKKYFEKDKKFISNEIALLPQELSDDQKEQKKYLESLLKEDKRVPYFLKFNILSVKITSSFLK